MGAKHLIVFHHTIHFSSVLLLAQGLPFVKFLFTLCHGYIDFGAPVLIDKKQRGDDGKAYLCRSIGQAAQFLFGEQQFAVAFRFVVAIRTIKIGADIHALHPQLAFVDHTKRIYQRSLARPNALDFGSREHNARGVGVGEEIFKRSFLVPNLNGAAFAATFILLTHVLSLQNDLNDGQHNAQFAA